MIFHIPVDLETDILSGSFIRPKKMIQAFKNIGYKVEEISGTIKQRAEKVEKIKAEIETGEFDFVYSENSTIPSVVSNKKHIPNNTDLKFLSFCKSKGVKIGLFYRDIYWKFLKPNNIKERLIDAYYKPFYKYELRKYEEIVDILFLPSLKMYQYIPLKKKIHYAALPPGGGFEKEKKIFSSKEIETNLLRVFYVGGVGGANSLYDITLLLKIFRKSNSKLTISCRKEEWEKNKNYYSNLLSKNITLSHLSGNELKTALLNSDIGCLIFPPSKYREFAFPFKVMEYIFYRLPIIATEGTEVANFITKNDIGWSVPYETKPIADLLKTLEKDKNKIKNKKDNILKILQNNTWESRARKVESLIFDL